MRKLILKTSFSLGDIVMMTAAVRDLHRCYPKRFLTDVRTHFPEVWDNNPYITCLDAKADDVETIDCRYPLINYANHRPYHCLHGYISFLNERLGLQIVPTEYKGDIHLSREEKEWASQVHELSDRDIPFWIVAAGGKHDITIKWWSTRRYQKVIDHFEGRVAFVQVGELGHHHPRLERVIDLRGQTTVRELIRLVYHSQGCLCAVTALMHLAAAVETKPGRPARRPCVVVAGGREPVNWEAYPHHRFLHTIGALPCCNHGGCWRSRTVALKDGDERDNSDSLCLNLAGDLPRCMSMISSDSVSHAIEQYFNGAVASYLTKREFKAAELAIRKSRSNSYDFDSLNCYEAPKIIERVIRRLPEYPGGFEGQGIVICGGGLTYFPCAWVCVRMLRRLGCQLPIEVWYEGKEEMDREMMALLAPFGVKCIDSRMVEQTYPRRMSGGWELKSYALIHSSFKEVLLLDADNVPIQDPSVLFETAEYHRTGSVFWPDYQRLAADRLIWRITGVNFRDEPEFETGQILVDKEKCWRALNLAFWFNDHSDFFFQHIHGDKETFHMAWRRLDQEYTMVDTPICTLEGTMCQHDLNGRRIFQHRNLLKWRAFDENRRVRGFQFERQCLEFLKELEQRWDGKICPDLESAVSGGELLFRSGTCDQGIFENVCEGNEYDLPERFRSKDVIIDIGAHIGSFSYACIKRGARRVLAFEPERQNFRLACYNLRDFKGRVRVYQKAVWRSDRHSERLLHSGYSRDVNCVNTGGGSVLVEAEKTPSHRPKEVVESIGLDDVLKRYSTVHLLKLDCEGSEWPILLTSKLLGRVQKICGEYHALDEIPTPAQVQGYSRYGKKELEEFLSKYYKTVRIQPGSTGRLGYFWAER